MNKAKLLAAAAGSSLALAGLIAVVSAADWSPATLPATRPADRPAAEGQPTWYRCYVRVPANMVTPAQKDLYRDSVTLSLAGIDGPFRVYLNGQQIGAADGITANARRRFKVPKDILQKGAFNVLAIRLDAKAAAKGIGEPPILAGYFDELLFAGEWEITVGEIAPDDEALKPAAKQPPRAAYTEAGFRPSSTPLNPNAELMPGRRLSPEDAFKTMKPSEGLSVDLLLAEPLVAQPTHISFDERGRMWVSQYRQYPYPAGLKMLSRDKYYRAKFDRMPPAPPNHDKGRDIISVHEDTDGDGVFDKHKNVLEGLNMANAAVYGHGGIWVMHTPYLLFYPDANGDDIPDRDPEVRLAGFGLEDTHSVANGLAWGPDGWLYGGQGSTTTSRVTRPGDDPAGAPGVFFEGCMVWRYHPDTRKYEIFAEGGGNTFGLDFDAEGRIYSGHNGGETHGWHFVQNGIYLKQGVDPGKFGPPANPYSFGQLPMMRSRNPIPRFTHNILFFEGTALPEAYIGRLFGADPLHRNLMTAQRYPAGSTFETSDTGVAVASDDIAFRPVYLTGAADGSLYIADFYEEFIAHGQNYQGQIDPTTGRIYRLRGNNAELIKDVNLSGKSSAELVQTLSHANRWHRQTAARLLGERKDSSAVEPLKALLQKPEVHPALEALWALHQAGQLDEPTTIAALSHPAAPVRAWAVRLAGDARSLKDAIRAAVLARIDVETDPEVRTQIASTARGLPASSALPLIGALIRRDADTTDPYLPLLCWWTLESHCDANRQAVLDLFQQPAVWDAVVVRNHLLSRLMRRFAARGTRADFLACTSLLKTAPKDEHRQLLMKGFEEAFAGRALPPLPEELAAALAQSGHATLALRVRLAEPEAIAEALKVVADTKAKPVERLTCVMLFGEVKEPRSVAPLLAIAAGAAEPQDLRKAALASLLRYDEPSIGQAVAGGYADLPEPVRPAAIKLLASRAAWMPPLLKLLEAGTVKPADIPAEVAARLVDQKDPQQAALARTLLSARPAPEQAAKKALADKVRAAIAAAPGDPYKGEPIYLQRCGVCHMLFHKGGRIGPDLTSYQRDDLGTMLPSVIDPSAEIREGFRSYAVTTRDGRELSGFLVDNDPATIAIRGFDGQDVRVTRAELQSMEAQPASLMPEGLLEGLSDQEIRDLFAYLRIPQPITR